MRYELHLRNADGSESRIQIDRNETLSEGESFSQGTTIYVVRRIVPGGGDEVDAVVEAERAGGPAQAGDH